MSVPNVQLGVPQGVPTKQAGGAGAPAGLAAMQEALTRIQPVATNVANFLRDNPTLKNRKGLLNNTDDTDFFRYKRMIRALTSDEYKAQLSDPKNKLPPFNDEKTAVEFSKILIQLQLVIPAQKLHYHEIKKTNKKWTPNKDKPTLIKARQADLSPDSYYVWNFTKPSPYMFIYGVLLLATIFTIILYPLWPKKMKIGVYYLSMGLLGLLGVFFVIAIIRLILYIITLIAGKPFWLFPNLFADCGVIESFIPLYEWEKPKKSKAKKQKPSVELKEVE